MGTAKRPRTWNYIVCLAFEIALFAGTLGLFPAPAHGLDSDKSLRQCRVDMWTRRDGLPARRIEALTQTRDGFIWMATRGGVVRFDGNAFRLFNYKNTPNFFRDMAVSVAVGPHGSPWIGTDGGGSGPLANGVFQPIATGPGKALWSQHNVIYTARDRSVWLAGMGQYPLVHVVNDAVKTFGENTPEGAAAAGCTGITEDAEGRLWMLSWSGLYRRDQKGGFQAIERCTDGTALAAEPNGGLWVGTKHGLLYVRNGRIRTYTTHDGLVSDDVHSLCQDRNGNLWIGAAIGISRLTKGKFTNFGRDDGLADTNVGPILEDREDSLWVATQTGLCRFAPTKLTPINFITAKGAAPRVSVGAEGSGGTVWFATSLGLFRVRGYATTHFGVHEGLPSDNIKSVVAGADGSLMVVDGNGDAYRFAHGRSTPVARNRRIEFLVKDSRGILAIGGDRTLYRVAANRFERVSKLGDCGWIFSTCVDSNDALWLATTVGLIQVKNGRAVSLNQGLPANTHVLAISPGSSGELWLGTDKGLGRFRNGACRLYSTAQGVPDDNFYSAQEDGEGKLWLGCTRGLLAVSLSDIEAIDSGLTGQIKFALYDDADGVRDFPVMPFQLRGADGRLWFAGEKGVTVVDPRNVRRNMHIPFVLIEQISGDERPLAVRPGESLAAGTNRLEFRYTSTSLAAPERVLFRFRLVGYDKSWVEAGNRRAAYYSNLPPGSYRFEVTACNNDGVWNPVGATYAFTLQPRFFQTNWFRGLCLIALIAVIWAIAGLRSRHLRLRNRELEERVAKRTAELHSSFEEIHHSKQMLESANVELQTSRHELAVYNDELTAINGALEAANAQLEALATTDGMTGIANHRAFQDQVRAVMARASRAENSTTLLLCDVDRFKQYNDNYGHPAGDEVLRNAARLLRQSIREGDFVARYGGEEFAILLPNTGSAEALEVAERVRRAVEEFPFAWRQVTLSIGISAPMAGVAAPQSLVESADRALYAAKNSGRNRVALGEVETAGMDRTEWMDNSSDNVVAGPHIEVDDVAELADGLLRVLNLRDAETNDHSQRVARYTYYLAQETQRQGFYSFSRQELQDIQLGALLHDIGKVGIPDAVLYKASGLSPEEWELMKTHTLLGAEVIRGCPHFAGAMPIVRSHHERWDGEGYPDRLHSKKIPLAARLFALADALDAMSTDRPYREALPYDTIREEVKAMAGRQFDPALVEIFLTVDPCTWVELAAGCRHALQATRRIGRGHQEAA